MYSIPVLTNLQETIPPEIVHKWNEILDGIEDGSNIGGEIKVKKSHWPIQYVVGEEMTLYIGLGEIDVEVPLADNSVRDIVNLELELMDNNPHFDVFTTSMIKARPKLMNMFYDILRVGEL